MLVTLDTSHSEMSTVTLLAPDTTFELNNWLISVTAETSQDPIGPCGPVEQSVDSSAHSQMAVWSSALEFGAHPVEEYFGGYTIAVRVRSIRDSRVS